MEWLEILLMAQSESRIHDRQEMVRPLRLLILSVQESGAWEIASDMACESRDLSSGGVGIRLDVELEVEQPVLVMVPGLSRTIRLFGRVRHCRDGEDGGYWIGVKFFGMPAELEDEDWVAGLSDVA